MKPMEHTNLKHLGLIATLLLNMQLLHGQSTIAYSNGPAFQLPGMNGYAKGIDLNGDGTLDCTFSAGEMYCTDDIPISGCTQPYYVSATGTNALLWHGGQVCVMSAASVIGSGVSANTVWGNPGQGDLLTIYISSPRDGTSTWTAPLQTLTNGYLGLRFYAADGLHYGWIHARLPDLSIGTNGFPAEFFSPVIVDWAYETRVNTAIVAGATIVTALQAAPQVVRAGYLRLNWQAETGKTYQIQSTANLLPPSWTNLDISIVATGTNALTDIPIASGAEFYRIVETN